MSKIQINLVRHGETIFNHQATVQGWGDSFLTPNGIQGVEKLGTFWQNANKNFDAIYASDSGRTLQTSRVLLDAMGAEHTIAPTPSFREYNFGLFEGGEDADVFTKVFARMGYEGEPGERSYAHMVDYFNTIADIDQEARGHLDNVYISEPYNVFVQRILTGIDNVVKEARAKGNSTVLIVSHGITIQTIIKELFAELRDKLAPSMGNASVSSFYVLPDGSLEFIGFAEPLGQ